MLTGRGSKRDRLEAPGEPGLDTRCLPLGGLELLEIGGTDARDRRKYRTSADRPQRKQALGWSMGKGKGLLAVTYLSSGWSPPVLSALGSFTAVFGMGTGGTTPL